MNHKRALLALVVIASITTIAMVIMSNMTVIQMRTSHFLKGGSSIARALPLANSNNNNNNIINNNNDNDIINDNDNDIINDNDNNNTLLPQQQKSSANGGGGSSTNAVPSIGTHRQNNDNNNNNNNSNNSTQTLAKTITHPQPSNETKPSATAAANNNKPTPAPQTETKPKPTTTQKPNKPPAAPTNRPMLCKNCFNPPLANIPPTPEVCSTGTGSTKPEMLMLITSSLDGFPRRQAIRDTWASVTKNNSAHVRHVFLLGTDGAGRVSEEVKAESARFKDVMVSDFVDTYGNLTFKTIAGLRYLVQHCGEAKYFLKTDQDMYVFVERLLELANKKDATLQTSIGGSCFQVGKPWRDPKTKYYASVQSYPQSTYPGFCSGTGYISSMKVARKILETSPNIPFFHLEDVYLALVMRHVGYRLTRYSGFAEGAGVCAPRGGVWARAVLTIHEVSPEKMREFWARKCGV
ncbi:beta-1,3-galactosyltransferase 1-like [Babylonia areolata]|uniref:beta-1,3-galactosyltransferase 1-like n=1 Tax=Babylonia areolata TaxID=304850 RepID=UPI003FCFD2AD